MPNNLLGKIKTPENPGLEHSGPPLEDKDTEGIVAEHITNMLHDRRKQAEEKVKDSQQHREQRKEYAGKIFWLVCGWLFVLLTLVFSAGKNWISLSDSVLIALITSASVNIIGLMVIVANYLFPKIK